MKKIGLAISLFNKVEELKTNVSIVRNYWQSHSDSYISVCCNDYKSLNELKNININKLIQGDNLSYQTKPQKRIRIFDCIKKSLLGAESEFVIHFHADAYALSVNSILNIIETMEKNNQHVAYRGKGLHFRSAKCIHGDVDDHFLIFRTSVIKDRKLFENIDVNSYFQVSNPESLLAYIISNNFNINEIYFYDNLKYNIVDQNNLVKDTWYDDGINHRQMNPYNLDKQRGFYHIGDKLLTNKFLIEYDNNIKKHLNVV